MKALISILASVILLILPAARADTVYRCVQNGKLLFTDEPAGSSCEPLHLQVPQPNPEDLARWQEKKRQRAEQERLEQDEAERRQLLQAQVDAARAAARQAEAQRRLAERQAGETRRQGYSLPYFSYWPGYGHPFPHPRPPYPPIFRPPPPAPIKPPTPDYPYAPDRISVGRPQGK